MLKRMSLFVALSFTLIASPACTTTTTIQSTPPGAKAYLNGRYLGTTPVKIILNDGFLPDAQYDLRLTLDCYRETNTRLSQNYNTGYLLLDVLLILPTFGGSIYLAALNGKSHQNTYNIFMEKSDNCVEQSDTTPLSGPAF